MDMLDVMELLGISWYLLPAHLVVSQNVGSQNLACHFPPPEIASGKPVKDWYKNQNDSCLPIVSRAFTFIGEIQCPEK